MHDATKNKTDIPRTLNFFFSCAFQNATSSNTDYLSYTY